MEVCFCFILSHNQHPKHDQPVVNINITHTEHYEHYTLNTMNTMNIMNSITSTSVSAGGRLATALQAAALQPSLGTGWYRRV